MTDEPQEYTWVGREFADHATVNHSAGEYARGGAHINTAESHFALVKRAVYGTHHHWSKHQLHRYLAERDFVWNTRMLSDKRRTMFVVLDASGKRLLFQEPKKSD